MSDSSTDLVAAFTTAAPDHLDERFQRLVGAVWSAGTLTEAALPAVPAIVAGLADADDERKGHLAVLLGMLAEAEYPNPGPVTAAVEAGIDTYLELLGRGVSGEPLTLALLYLLAHLPAHADRILGVAAGLGLEPDDQTRLERGLEVLDLETVVLGRAWPSPHEWSLSDSEREFDRGWITKLSAEQITTTWVGDTRTVWAYSGAKAYWAVGNGKPTVVDDSSPHREPVEVAPTELTVADFRAYAGALRCPTCRSALEFGAAVRCDSCSTNFPISHGILDVLATEGHADEDVLQNAAAMQGIGAYYEAVLRPAFLRVMGANWGGDVAPSDEDDYIVAGLREVDGPVLDLAAGAGRWTVVVDEAVAGRQLIGLDVNAPMLIGMRSRLPEVPAVLGSALTLPFGDGTLGAVNCWNALQAMPDAEQAIREVGRCLRPGGTFVALTFRWSDDPVYRYFQGAHRFPGWPDGIELFTLDDIRGWLDSAGLEAGEASGPGTFVFITAERRK